MDTDDLTPMAYETISRAGNVLDVLRSEIGASAQAKKTEEDFLRGVRAHLRTILRSAREYLDYWNYLGTIDRCAFRKDVQNLLTYVETTLATSYEQRGGRKFKK
jgi:hypothetical protein